MGKVTFLAEADVALVKYWGKKDEKLRLPTNGSISMVLDGLRTKTTVEFDEALDEDEVVICGEREEKEVERVVKQLERIRRMAGSTVFARVMSKNSFPKATGLSSSGSGFAALTLAAVKALKLNLSKTNISILARQGSGTACRCVCGGFVEWKEGRTSKTSYAETVFPKGHWDLRDVIAVVAEDRKTISSTEGHKSAVSSPFYRERQKRIQGKILQAKELIRRKNFQEFGRLIESEALEFHSILLTSKPAHLAWFPGTIEVMREVQRLRQEGIKAYYTINTGFNLHVLTLPMYEKSVSRRLAKLSLVKKILKSKVGGGPREVKEHLF